MPFPYTRYRSRNRARVNQKIPPLVSTVAGPTAGDASASSITFPAAMDTTITAIPPGFTIAGHQVTGLTWSTSTLAIVSTGTALVALDAVVFPATNVLRSANGGSVRPSTFALVA